MGVATFIENDYGTQTSKALVYNTWWFEAILIFFVINFFGNIFRYRLYRKEKWAVLLFHVSFLLILIGAGVTRYIGFEGIMIINEGETTNKFLSETTYLNVIVDNDKEQKVYHKPLLLSAWGKNSVEYKDNFREQQYSIKLAEYIPWAEKKLVEDENGVEHLFFVESSSGSRHEHYIKKGTVQNIHNILVGFDTPERNASINFYYEDGSLKMSSKSDGNWLRMADQKKGNIVKDSAQHFQFLTLHTINGLQFVIPRPAEKGEVKTISGPLDKKKKDVIVLDITSNNETKQVELAGGQYNSQNSKEFSQAIGLEIITVDLEQTKSLDGKDKTVISSQSIRGLISNGELETAKTLLGRNWCVTGIVKKGKQQGRELGFPTANLDMGYFLKPPFGVYVTKLKIIDHKTNKTIML